MPWTASTTAVCSALSTGGGVGATSGTKGSRFSRVSRRTMPVFSMRRTAGASSAESGRGPAARASATARLFVAFSGIFVASPTSVIQSSTSCVPSTTTSALTTHPASIAARSERGTSWTSPWSRRSSALFVRPGRATTSRSTAAGVPSGAPVAMASMPSGVGW